MNENKPIILVPSFFLAFFLVLSYNSEGIMPSEKILDTLKQYGTVKLEQFEYARFKSNNNGLARIKKTVFEQLYILKREV